MGRPALVVAAADLGPVLTAAATCWQPFVTVWRQDAVNHFGVLEVVDLASGRERGVVSAGGADLHRVGVRTCPLVPDAGSGDLCMMHGGPWVSRSITAATRWEARRARMIRALGCDTCGDGAITVFAGRVLGAGRQGIPIRPDTATPTRHDRLVAVPRHEAVTTSA